MPHEFICTQTGNCYYRTVLMSANRAQSFCRCLQHNNRFKLVSVVASTSEGRFFVQYQPSRDELCGALYARQYSQREAKGRKEAPCYQFSLVDNGTRPYYLVETLKKEVYEVCAESCTCPDFVHRCQKAGLSCKHQVAYHAMVAAGEIVSLVDVARKFRAPLYSDFSWPVVHAVVCNCGAVLASASEEREGACNRCLSAPLPITAVRLSLSERFAAMGLHPESDFA